MYRAATGTFSLFDWVMAYGDAYRGGVTLKLADLDNDALSDIVVTPTVGGPNVRVYTADAGGTGLELLDWFMPYEESFHGGVTVKIANVDGDDTNEIVTVPTEAGGPNVRVYEYDGTDGFDLLDWFMAYQEDYRGSMEATVADLEGDGDSELIITPLTNGGPNVRVYDHAAGELELDTWFWGYDPAFRGGVQMVSGR